MARTDSTASRSDKRRRSDASNSEPDVVASKKPKGQTMTTKTKTKAKAKAIVVSPGEKTAKSVEKAAIDERGKIEERGWWCSISRCVAVWMRGCEELMRLVSENETTKKARGSCAGWFKGGNSTCRQHITSAHYETYSEQCKELGIEENF